MVSNYGQVRSLDRVVTRSNNVQAKIYGRMMCQHPNTDGYPTVHLSKDGIDKRVAVHILVAHAFLPPPPDDTYEINHIDCNRTNNCVLNLEWITHGDNVRYAIQCGHHVCTKDLRGANNPNYGNTTLHKFYQDHPELALVKLSRPGAQNGRATPITMVCCNGDEIQFSYIGECATYLIEHGFTSSRSVNHVRDRITKAKKNNITYLGHKFK